jgi:hypothetical protein
MCADADHKLHEHYRMADHRQSIGYERGGRRLCGCFRVSVRVF